MLKVFHSEMHGCHWIPLGVSGYSMPDRISIDTVLIRREEETDKVCLGEDIVCSGRGVVGLIPNE